MKNNLFKLLTEFGPLAIFALYYYKNKDVMEAITPFLVATILSLIIVKLSKKKIAVIPLVGSILIIIFYSLSLIFSNPVFIFIRPTILNISLALALILNKKYSKKLLLKSIIGHSIKMKNKGWNILTQRWIKLLFILALLNEFIWRTQNTEVWVNYKLWGILLITLVFSFFQINLIKKNKI
jgi:intracellular septation protein